MPKTPVKVKKENWIWMPHPAHLCVSDNCRFKLATYVGGYIVSTVGEYVPDSSVREIFNKIRNLNLKGMGDEREADFLKKNDFEEIGYDRKYETMVFKAKKSKLECCPYEIIVSKEVDMEGYNDAKSAYKGHLRLCKKWSNLNAQSKKKSK